MSFMKYLEFSDQASLSSQKPKNPPEKNQKLSLLYGVFAGILFGLGNYTLGIHVKMGYLATCIQGNGALLVIVISTVCSVLASVIKKKQIWTWEDSNFRNNQTGGFHWKNLAGILIYCLVVILTALCINLTFRFALYADINQGILTSIFGVSALISAVLAYFLFGDKLKNYHIFGMIMIMFCVIGFAFGQTSKIHHKTNSENATFYSILSISLACLCPLGFALQGMTARYTSENYGLDSSILTACSYTILNVLYLTVTICMYSTDEHPFILSEYLIILFSGCILYFGVLCVNKALVLGLAGPVFSLENIEVIIMTILDIIFMGVYPNSIEILSACVGVAGCITICLYPEISKLCESQRN
ncbi:unnamed protein product [Moneuplotes crassus]|uniref:EamA domain-containing protein n=1 Tax=Euplotes crassus TaxID=5936 RepID=A0AAD1URF8_EUPCR|nr:unnamed protein product [Moneuplotes crassus]